MAPDEEQVETADDRTEASLAQDRTKASLLERALMLETTGVDLVDKAANEALQKGLDNAKIALLPLFYFYLPLVAIFIIVVVELLLPIWRSSWQLPLWRKVLYWVYVLMFLLLTMTILGTIAYAYAKPQQFCELALGGTWWGAIPGVRETGCSVYGWVFNLLKPG
jgi:hypothetical protein